MNIFHWTVKKSNGNENLILKTGRDIFIKFQKNLTSRQSEHVGPRYERAKVKFDLFLRLFEYETEIHGSRMEKLLILRPLY